MKLFLNYFLEILMYQPKQSMQTEINAKINLLGLEK